MKGVIIYNASFYGEGVKNQTEELKAEFEKLDVGVRILSSDSFTVKIEGDKVVTDIGEADFIVYLNKDVVAARLLEKCGYKLFNSAFSIELCDDKALTYAYLANSGVPLIKTVVAPNIYYGSLSDGYLERASENLKYPIVVKVNKSSLGEGVYLAKDDESLKEICGNLGVAPIIFQEFYGERGRDLRVIVIGGKAVAAMERINENDFRANIELGGKGYSHELSVAEKALAERTAEILGLDYCGVDILAENGELKVCEVNSNAFFKAVSAISGKNVAKIYAEYIFAQNRG